MDVRFLFSLLYEKIIYCKKLIVNKQVAQRENFSKKGDIFFGIE
jgi:hypothetical protein